MRHGDNPEQAVRLFRTDHFLIDAIFRKPFAWTNMSKMRTDAVSK